MTWLEHISNRKDVYLLILTWAAVGVFFSGIPAVIYSIATFLLVLRTRDLTNILLVTLAMLVLSDSRSSVFEFASTAKIGVVILLLMFIIVNFSILEVKRNDVFRFFLPYLLFSLLATIWATDTFTAFQKSFSYGTVFFLIPLIYLNGRKENRLIGVELIYFMAGILAVGLILFLVYPSFATLVGRYRGLLGNPNGLGIFLTVLFAVFYPTMKRHQETLGAKGFLWTFYLILLVSVVLTGSRTALIAISLFFLFDRLRYLSNAFTLAVFITLIMSYEYLLLQLPSIIYYFGLEEYFRLDTLEEGSGRFVAWNFAWLRAQEVFFVGGGYGHTEYVFKLFQDELSRLGHQGNAHNSYLTIWLDTGLIGIVLFGIGLIRSILKAIQNSPYTLPIMYAVLFSTFFESWLSASLNPFTSLFIISLTILSSPPDQESVPDVIKG